MRRRLLKPESLINLQGRKILACGDLHVRETTPSMRTEKNFFEEVVEPKIVWVVDKANEHEATICIAGDIFDNAHPRYYIANRISQLLRKAKYGIFAVPGQHDMNYHSQLLMDTPYQSLIESGVIQNIHGTVGSINDIMATGAGFGIDPMDLHADILLVHACITENNPPFFLEEALAANDYLDKYLNWKIIISGDYHVSHVTEYDGRILVNCGPMFRKDKTQINQKPRVFLINVDDNSYQSLYIPIRPGDEAFDLTKIERAKKLGISENDVNTTKLQQLITGKDENTALDFSSVVSLVCTQFETDRGITIPKDKLLSIIQRASNG